MSSHRGLLVVDVGNTATSFGFYKDPGSPQARPESIQTVSTSRLASKPALQKVLSKITALRGVIVSSVVPKVDRPLRSALSGRFAAPVHFVNHTTTPIIKVKTRHPAEVGADRIVNARAAVEILKGPVIVLDFGTATTFDCVNAKREYVGGVIAPGPLISAEALYARTAKLPMVRLDKAVPALGRDTQSSIQSGLYHGYRGLVREIVARLKKELGGEPKVLATGGQAKWILKDLGVVDKHEPYLTLFGLKLMWQDRFKEEL